MMDILQKRLLLKSNTIKLPDKYQQVSYIEGSGRQYIDSNYLSDNDYTPCRIKTIFQCTDITNSGAFWGAAKNSGNICPFLFAVDADRSAWVFGHFGNQSTRAVRFGTVDIEKHNIEYIFNKGIYFDGTLVPETVEEAKKSSVPNCNIGIFTRIRGGVADATYCVKGRIFDLEFYGLNGIERKFIPCYEKETGTIGLFEAFTQEFLTNKGTGEFMKGEDIYVL